MSSSHAGQELAAGGTLRPRHPAAAGSHQILSGAQLNLPSSTPGSTSQELVKPKSWHLTSVLPCRHTAPPGSPGCKPHLLCSKHKCRKAPGCPRCQPSAIRCLSGADGIAGCCGNSPRALVLTAGKCTHWCAKRGQSCPPAHPKKPQLCPPRTALWALQ